MPYEAWGFVSRNMAGSQWLTKHSSSGWWCMTYGDLTNTHMGREARHDQR